MGKTQAVSLNIDKEVWMKFKMKCIQNEVTMSYATRKLLESYINIETQK